MNRPWKCVLIAAFVCIGASAQTPVTTSGGITYNIPAFNGAASIGSSPIYVSGWNVGIGTSTPQAPLDVAGDIRNYRVDGSQFYIQNPPSDVRLWALKPDGSPQQLLLGINGGNVGIGVGNALSALHVNGDIRANSIIFPDGSQLASSSAASLSPLTLSGSNVGIGITNPVSQLDVSGVMHVSGSVNPTTTTQGAYLGWNALTGGMGETDLINNQGGGAGGIAFMNVPASGSPRATWMFLNGSGNLGINSLSPGERLEVNGNIKLTANSGAHVVFADGSQQSVAWTGGLSGGDYAESVDVTGDRTGFEPGDVLVIDPKSHGHFQKASTPYSALIGGVYATKPGVTGRRQPRTKSIEDEVPMAMVGIVPTKVSTENGPIHDGDLLVSSSTPGYAMKGTDRDRMMGAVIGKALAPLETGSGVIEVLISLQ